MTKKRIADLLKEEVEETNQGDQTQVTSSSKAAEPASEEANAATPVTGTNRTRKPASKTAKATAAKQTTAKTGSTAALEKQITGLEASLKQAQEKITGLQDDIKTHQARIFELKDELAGSQKAAAEKTEILTKVTAELETAKETIRQITASQQADIPDIPESEEPRETSTQVIHGADLATNRNTLSLRNPPRSYKSIPDYAIQRGDHNSMLSDDDIGWVD